MTDKLVKISTRIPTVKSFDGQAAGAGRIEGKPLVELVSDALPGQPGAVKIAGHWFVPADPAEAHRLNHFWRHSR